MMQQHTSDALIQKEKQRLDISKREEVVLRYISVSLPIIKTIKKMKSLNK